MSIINFTIHYALFTGQADGDDANVDVDIIPLVGDVTFTPVLVDDRAIMAQTYDPAAGFRIPTISGYIDSDGILRAARSGPEGVRLWANDPIFGLPTLSYRVDFNLTTPLGSPVRVRGGYFPAPNDDREIQLADVLQSGVSIGGPHIVGGEFVDDTVIFENADGSLLRPITIPAGILVFVDNGDATWSVG